MITVKGTKSETQQNDPADIYALKAEPQNARTPYVIGALIAALVLYLKSAISPKAATAGEEIDEGAVSPVATSTPLTQDVLSPPLLEHARSIDPEPEITPRVSFKFSATATQTNFHGSKDVQKTLTSGFSGKMEAPANWDSAPNARPDEVDLQSLFGSADAIADAWPPEEPIEESAVIDETHVRNRAPRSGRPNYLFDVTSGAMVMIALSDLLANISDPDGDELTILDASVTSGTLTKVDGGYLFRADPAMLGPVQMKFTVSDGQASIPEVAHFSIVPNEKSGTDQADVLAGTFFIDEIHGLANDDNIDARAGNDFIYGGSGDDTLSGGQGDDVIFGGAGNDKIQGGAGNDLVSGGDGNDHIFGDGGDDILFGDAGDDFISDGIGADIVFGGAGDDLVAATADVEMTSLMVVRVRTPWIIPKLPLT
ncbi:calcium-binding protein [Pseudorhodobacter wandonensis]|uniref:calcium-binding protein n=1 Tax=Pseudorhodobacter wandonensis TaxID=1120568 RepID=UPI00067B6035|nr:cadherin-like domain-containing protein [Pseudorhodobacter wandonensis]